MHRKQKMVALTKKGLAVLAAAETGLLPRVEGGWDDTVFNKFWDRYETLLAESGNNHSSNRKNT